MEQHPTPFSSLSISAPLLQALEAMGFTTPSPIQAQAIPPLLAGKDVLGQAATGTGKTAAFGIPAVQRLEAGSRQTQVLVVCPTRELAVQVCAHIKELAQFQPEIRTTAVFGGQSIEPQRMALKHGAQIVVGTPGRLLDLLERGSLRLDAVKTVVLDEADQMLDMGFYDDIMSLLKEVSSDRQTVLFSATMSSRILALTKKLQKNPVTVTIQAQKLTAALITQHYHLVQPRSKEALLARLLWFHNPLRAIVFCNTKAGCEEVVQGMRVRGINGQALHGDLDQPKRLRIMQAFRDGKINVLVATDVAARGIDVSGVDMVINHELPRDPESYVHRIGRTGRAGASGVAISLVSPREMSSLRSVMYLTNADIAAHPIPTDEEVINARAQSILHEVKALAKGEQQTLAPYQTLLESLGNDLSAATFAAALLKRLVAYQPEQVDAALPRDQYEDRRPRYEGGSNRGGPRRQGGSPRGGGYAGRRRSNGGGFGRSHSRPVA